MGTSKAYGGPVNGLIPDFVDNPPPPTLPLADDSTQDIPVTPPDSSGAGPFRTPKANFTRYSRSGSRSSLGKAVAGYVRKGMGGAGRASRRMGSSRTAAGGLLGLISDYQQGGATQALGRFYLGNLAGQSASSALLSLVEFLCPPGGSVDEGIARQAMLDTISDMSDVGEENFDELTPDQLKEVFISFVVHSIEGRIMADIGKNGIKIPDDIDSIVSIQEDLHDFVDGATRTQLRDEIRDLSRLSGDTVDGKVEEIYTVAFELLAREGERLE
ncbi:MULTISPECIES: Qat anti-phage system associated protein QatB [Klebsiella/Raoultella group]|uniref:Qat anti-phage system associated protein QatB n=1 Tax=Klebsiella/Raoultella group TaxID=2890311 RepID=UPI0019163CD3|nr:MULTISPECIES: Qat anti-phage system associated protein QatB [Klebsiella/Raoultella group]MDC7944851.1 hypothetical protein [Raoultella ornithinolytica]QQM79407.1 hypothetical protein JII91_22115 [Klebsiella quasipneumoniae]